MKLSHSPYNYQKNSWVLKLSRLWWVLLQNFTTEKLTPVFTQCQGKKESKKHIPIQFMRVLLWQKLERNRTMERVILTNKKDKSAVRMWREVKFFHTARGGANCHTILENELRQYTMVKHTHALWPDSRNVSVAQKKKKIQTRMLKEAPYWQLQIPMCPSVWHGYVTDTKCVQNRRRHTNKDGQTLTM